MRVLIVDDNLLWSDRLRRCVASLGYDASVDPTGEEEGGADVVIVNLGSPELDVAKIVQRHPGATVIGRCGHKEAALREAAMAAGCHRLATNGELSRALPRFLASLDPS
ncbi:MAG: hypothetical protein KIT11_10930 [Fimbriimonadaceae bacterium]|nr:hypothetical protein [Fimbriimonadaceae bacterium]QYK55835.1 MAG: hypothetical protein KF733_12600 [Fimbriimonadaceae bacterium]